MKSSLKNLQSLSSDLLASLQKPEFCDTKIQASDGELSASKHILSIRSEYFCGMFSNTNNITDSSSDLVKLPYPKAVVEAMLLYLYSGEMEFSELLLGQLLDLLDLLRMMNLSMEFKQLESYVLDNIPKNHFSYSECFINLDKSSKIRMEAVGKTLMSHLRNNLNHLCQLDKVCVLSETMIIKLLQEEESSIDEEGMKLKEEQTIIRFKTFVKWLSANSVADNMKAKAAEMFDFNHFTVQDLASSVRQSGLYPSKKIIERMEQCFLKQEEILTAKQRTLDINEEQLEILKKEKKKILSEKNKEITQLKKEKKALEENLNRKRKINDPTPEGAVQSQVPNTSVVDFNSKSRKK